MGNIANAKRMKFIILAIVFYALYHYFKGSFLPPGQRRSDNSHLHPPEPEEEEGEYIDYEELD